MLSFPLDIIIQIFVKVPARDLWRLRRVSKSWHALIFSPFFINMHLSHSTQMISNQTLVFFNGFKLFHLRIDDLLDHNGIKKLNCTLESGPSSMVFGSCNGLFLVYKGGYTCRKEEYGCCRRICMKDLGIWNPNTGEYKSLPPPLPVPETGVECSSDDYPDNWVDQYYGFGHDLERDDYIVVKINVTCNQLNGNGYDKVDIYSMKLNSWRRIECPSLPSSLWIMQFSAVFSSGSLHWAVQEDESKDWLILAFNVGNKEFYFVAKPDKLPCSRPSALQEVKGELYLTCNCTDFLDIWILRREYGEKESWNKLLSMPSPAPSTRSSLNAPINRPLAFSSFGNKILLNPETQKLILYDLAEGTEEEIQIGGLEGKIVAYSCLGSLVRLSNYETTVNKY